MREPTPAGITWGTPVDHLRLGLSTHGPRIGLHLQNIGQTPLEVMSHVAAQELHLDWYTLALRAPDGAHHTLKLYAPRDRSAAVKVTLAAQHTLHHLVDVRAWAARFTNGNLTLAPGTYQISATYTVPEREGAWAGRLEAGPVAWVAEVWQKRLDS